MLSLPSWERGLKLCFSNVKRNCLLSLPSWERGLKFCQAVQVLSSALVAPFVGAWIEIFGEMPFVCFEWKSLPSWERGLKFINGNSYVLWGTVAPFVGAWIEIL